MVAYEATTNDVTVTVRPIYLDEHSNVVEGRFVFAYLVVVVNDGSDDVQLLRRTWTIRDSAGRVQEVEGAGVIGKQPVIPPGERHEYHSFCILETFEGEMEGNYLMQRANGKRFRARIPRFHLRALTN